MHEQARNTLRLCFFLSGLSLLTVSFAWSQAASQTGAPVETPSLVATSSLPDSPGAVFTAASSSEQTQSASQQPPVRHRRFYVEPGTVAPTSHKLILPGEVAPPLTARDKVYLGLIHGVSPFSIAGWFFASGYEQVTDGSPNYGVDKGAFGQRLAASAVRGYSEQVIGTSILAPLFHEDPRYYRIGSRHGYFYRTIYAVTRPIITKADDGHYRPNFSLVLGNLAGASLTNAYYPSRNRGFHETLGTFEGSMGGAAFSAVLDEYLGELLQAAHLKHFHE